MPPSCPVETTTGRSRGPSWRLVKGTGTATGSNLGATTQEARTAWGALQYLGTTTLPPGWLVFTLCYAGRERAVSCRPGSP